MTIAIIGAMLEEVSAIQGRLTDLTCQSVGSVNFYKGHFQNIDVVLACSGIGKVHAAVATTLIIQLYHPYCIINTGTLGALYPHLKPGTIILSESVLYHDVDVTEFGYAHGQIPQMPADYSSSHQLLQLFENIAAKTHLPLYKGVGVTGDQFIASTEKLNKLKEKFPRALGIDMETAAIAHVAHLFGIPFVSVRAVTDFADEESAAKSEENLISAADTAGNLVISAIADIPGVLGI